jgi:hypothetical protein
MRPKQRKPIKNRSANSCRPPKARGGCKPAGASQSNTLGGLVDCYLKMQNDRSGESGNPLRSLLEGYRELGDFKKAVEHAIDAKELVGSSYGQLAKFSGKRHGHQRRIEKDALTVVQQVLIPKKLKGMKSFDELHAHVTATCLGIKGIGQLYIYDAALRIGAALDLSPELVHLHAGTKKGVKALGLNAKNSSLPVNAFPKAIQKLKPHEIEDFLCIFKDELKAFKI